jgi:hypothetical protein
MASANLLGVRLKIERAKHHFDELKAAIHSWHTAEEDEHSYIINHDPDRKCVNLALQKVRANNTDWALIAGDVVHNLRSALDHLVCQLALLNGKPPSCCNKTSYPIFLTDTAFIGSKARSAIEPLIHPDALAIIEESQPYNTANATGKDPSKSNLWIVSQLDIIDKHRMLVVAAKYFRVVEISFRFNDGPNIPVVFSDGWQPLKDGAHVGTVDLTDLNPKDEDKMHVTGQTEVQIFFNETGCGVDGLAIDMALGPCIRYVSYIVDAFAQRFFP